MKAQDLKNSILQLAIQGKLVAQDANDEPAEVLYAKIQSEKQKLIKEGKIKKNKPLPPITDDEMPFEIPPTWKWVRFDDIVKYNMGKTPSRNDYELWGSDYPWVSIADLVDGKVITTTKEQISQKSYDDVFKKRIIPTGTLLMSFKLTIGKVSILGFDGFHNEAIISILPYVDIEKITTMYLFKLLPYLTIFSTEAKTAVKGVTLNSDSLNKLLIPLPPLVEQKRIVAKIEELEPLFKQYDKAETELSALNGSFPEQLKKSILQYAIQGKLVAQDANDEPAEVLYAKIQAEKQKLIKEGKIKKDKPLPPITNDEVPFSIPPSWMWVRLGDIVNNLTAGGDKPKIFSENKTEHNIYPVIANGKINDGILGYTNKPVVTSKSITVSGRGTMGFVCIREANFVPIVRLLVLQINTFTDINFLKYTIEALVGEGTGSAVQQLTVPMLKPLLIPLPPLAEQKRIVTKVNELMQYCEELAHPEKRKSVEPITIEWLIDKGFDSCKQNGYTDINAIFDELGIVAMQDRNLKKGRIEYDNNKKKFQIWIKDLNDNWTKTHELVHYVNDNNEIKLYGAVGRKDETSLSKSKERNVDVLTAEILMPEDIFISAVKQNNIQEYALINNAIIRKLSKQFRVSDDAVKIRLQNLGYHTK